MLGVEHAVVAPGSRSTPMALALVGDGRFRVHVFHDERSAAFAALGIGMATSRPAVLLCTSGTAAAEFFPAVAEASQACVPMLVCTADRPPELQGVGAPQTMDQERLYGGYVRSFHNVAPPTWDDSGTWRVVATGAFDASVARPCGPVHLNLQFRDPLVGSAAEIPVRPAVTSASVSRAMPDTNSISELAELGSGVILAGAGVDDPQGLVRLGERLGWPVVADPRSGCRALEGKVVTHADAILRHGPTAEMLTPHAILRVGEPPASKVVNQWVGSSGARVVAVTSTGRRIDPEGVVGAHVTCGVADIAEALKAAPARPEFAAAWQQAEEVARASITRLMDSTSPITEPWAARTVASVCADDEILLLSSSMPVRDVEWFADRCPRQVFANRGVNGIDGVMSTGVGLALGSSRRVTVLIGDVAYLHDSNALINLQRRDVTLRIVVVDNRGGGIFSFLDQAKFLEREQFELLYGTPHDTDLLALARAHGLSATVVSERAEFVAALNSMDTGVLVVRTRRDENVADHQRLNDAVADALSTMSNSR